MRKAVKVLGLVIAGVVLTAGLAACGWIFVTSNVEQPDYQVVAQEGAIELRDYPRLVVAEVTRRGDRKSAVNAGFRPLADYIFAKERAGESIAMTAPVTQERARIAMTAPVTQSAANGDGSDAWVVRFIMPAEYDLESLPAPQNPDVRLDVVPPTRRAAIRFSGVATDSLLAEQEALLRDWLARNGLPAGGAATFAYYNDPFTPGFLRRNEVLLDLPPGAGG